MGTQSLRQAARRDARTVAARRRAELLERSRRIEDLAVNVMTAIKERDLAVEDAERKVGEALHRMTTHEGLTLREAVEWCGDSVDLHEGARLRKIAAATDVVEAGESPEVTSSLYRHA